MTISLPLHHIGIAVRDIDSAILRYSRDFGFPLLLREELQPQGISLAFLGAGGSKIELIAPIAGRNSTLDKFLESQGEGLHHVCYQTKNIREELIRLSNIGYTLIDKEPRIGAEHSLIAFIHPRSNGGVLLELCEEKARAEPL